MAHYTHTESSDNPSYVTMWNNIELSPRTVRERNNLKGFIDDFASFTWRGIDAFDTFGAFIINNKNSLKFYNGPSFSNEYTKPQFETAAGQLTGVTFQVQKIDFTIGVYWISEDDYRQLIYWLHPYEINTLTFGFEPNYYYQVKLASIDNGIRYIVGREDDKYMYYTEMKLTFEIQGPAVAYGNTYFAFKTEPRGSGFSPDQKVAYFQSVLDSEHETRNSHLETPIIIESVIDLNKINYSGGNLIFSARAKYNGSNDSKDLFSVELKNLTYDLNNNQTNKLHLTYNSESALMFWQKGDSMQELLTRLTTLSTGDRLVDNITVNQFRIPGIFEDSAFLLKDLVIEYTLSYSDSNTTFENGVFDAQVISRPRTNLI